MIDETRWVSAFQAVTKQDKTKAFAYQVEMIEKVGGMHPLLHIIDTLNGNDIFLNPRNARRLRRLIDMYLAEARSG